MAKPFPTAPASECALCTSAPFRDKAGSSCAGCPAFADTHYFPYSDGDDRADVIVIGDVPQAPRLFLAANTAPRWQETHHGAFRDDGARVVKQAISRVADDPRFAGLKVRYAYAARCTADHLSKRLADACRPNLAADLRRVHERRLGLGYDPGLTVLACGVSVLHALGVPARKEKEALGRVFDGVVYEGIPLTVVATRSLAAFAGNVGRFNTLLADIERLFRAAKKMPVEKVPRELLAEGYILPRTEAEVTEVVDLILGYSGDPDVAPIDWAVSADTETNTLHPHWSGLKLLAASFSWDDGLATCIAVDHSDTPYDPEYAKREIKRLLGYSPSGAPTAAPRKWVWHNGKYDQKVLWHALGLPKGMIGRPGWDTLLAEHILEEAKPEEYGLKPLVKRFFPQYAGYEDQLVAKLVARDAAMAGEAQATQVTKTRAVKLPQVVADALARATERKHVTGPNFRASTIEKLLKRPVLDAEVRADLQVLLAAKAAGEFTGKAEKQAEKRKKQMGGYEDVPLDDLLFYGCIDADVTRRLSCVQLDRMREEDDKIRRWRDITRTQAEIETMQGNPPRHQVLELCTRADPQVAILREFKLPRQVELAKIEYLGVKVDRDYLAWGQKELAKVVDATSSQIFEMCTENFKLGSPKKLASFLFYGGPGFVHPNPAHAEEIARQYPEDVRYVGGRMSYRPTHFTATKQIQTSEAVLKGLVSKYKCPLTNLLLSLKKADKAQNSFFGNADLLSSMFGDGMLHGGYNLTGTATDRLSSSSGVSGIGFNYQNVPKGLIGALRDTFGNLVLDARKLPVFDGVNCKKLFIPDDPSMCFGNADAKGAEVTIFGTYAHAFPGGEALVNALCDGLDPHCFFGSEALNPALVAEGLTGEARRLALEKAGIDDDHPWSYRDFFEREAIKKKGVGRGLFESQETWEYPDTVKYALRLDALRDNIKRVVFGMLFGAGITKIAEIAGIPLDLAQKIKDLLFTKFPSIPAYMEHTRWEVNQFALVETFHGGRRRFPMEPRMSPKGLLARFERQAINFKIQRTNSDIVLMVLCWIAEILERDMGGRVLLTVHDSIGFQCPKKYAHQIPDLFMEQGTKRVAKECPWLKSPYRWDVALGENYGEYKKAKAYIEGLPAPTPRPELDGYTRADILYDLIHHEEFDPGKRDDKTAA